MLDQFGIHLEAPGPMGEAFALGVGRDDPRALTSREWRSRGHCECAST